eukprot:462870_1
MARPETQEHIELMWSACTYCFILCIVMCFYLYHFNKRRNMPVFRKRLYGFVFTINLCAIFFVGYLSPMWILTEMTNTITLHHNTVTFYFVLGLPYIVCQHLFTLLILCRFWLLHFQIQWTSHTKMLQILTQINPSAKDMSWYIRHRVTLGNPKVCVNIMTVVFFIIVGISSGVYFLCFDTDNRYIWCLTDSILLTLPIIGAFIIWFKTPKFFDLYLIRKELSIIMICDGLGIIGYIITILCLVYASEEAIVFVMIVGIVFGATIYSAISLISTFWVLQFEMVKGHQKSTSSTLSTVNSANSDIEQSPSPRASSPRVLKHLSSNAFIPRPVLNHMASDRLYCDGRVRPEHDVKKTRDHGLNVRELTLYNVLEHPFGFYAFLCHATKEYSVENLLAVVEMQQFQDYYQGKKRDIRFSIALEQEAQEKTDAETNRNEDCNVQSDSEAVATPSDTAGKNEADLSHVFADVPSQSKKGAGAEQIKSEQLKQGKRNSRNQKKAAHLRKHARMMSSMNELLDVTMQHHSFNLASDLPQSAIVYDEALSMRDKILALCDKYIARGGEFELNLGSSHRMTLLAKRENLDAFSDDECASCFNDTIYAVIALMHDSFIRFQLTNSYEELRSDMLFWSDEKRRLTLV